MGMAKTKEENIREETMIAKTLFTITTKATYIGV
jgi:hypothetical protein